MALNSIEQRRNFMRHCGLIASSFTLAMVVGSQAIAQQQPANPAASGTPDVIPFDIPYGMPITAEKAKQILSAAEAEAIKRGWKESIAVVDPNGELIQFLRMDGAMLASVTISQGKARTAARFRRPTQVFYNAYETGHPNVSTLDPTLIAFPGGFPLVESGKLIGAIGCSGGTGDQDA